MDREWKDIFTARNGRPKRMKGTLTHTPQEKCPINVSRVNPKDGNVSQRDNNLAQSERGR
jgi:hypothetical protein